MLSNLELYGTEDVPPVPKFVADERIEILEHHLEEQLALPFQEQNNFTQTKILVAIRFWKKMSNQEDTGL